MSPPFHSAKFLLIGLIMFCGATRLVLSSSSPIGPASTGDRKPFSMLSGRTFFPGKGASPSTTTLSLQPTTTPMKRRTIQHAIHTFSTRPSTYFPIPFIAAAVGWVTNWLAVKMIFYPLEFRGINIWRHPEMPFGVLGWQGIVPCKTRPMTEVMVHMVTTQLLSIEETFAKLDPKQMALLLSPQLPMLTSDLVANLTTTMSSTTVWAMENMKNTLSLFGLVERWHKQFIAQFTESLQRNIESVFDLRNCVVQQMLQDRGKLGELFRKCGQKELDFLTNSGAWFGFLLGIIQMGVALLWDNPWTLSVGGLIVGYATNWLALKWIFQPVDPVSLGPFTLQGMFLRRQPEVAREFSQFFANHILTAEQLWKSLLTDSTTRPALGVLLQQNIAQFLGLAGRWIPPESLSSLADAVLDRLPLYVSPSYQYMDKTLGLEDTLRVRMEGMSSRQFERVLHPIFEEDELTLIIAGAVLGFAAGLVQQGLATGSM